MNTMGRRSTHGDLWSTSTSTKFQTVCVFVFLKHIVENYKVSLSFVLL